MNHISKSNIFRQILYQLQTVVLLIIFTNAPIEGQDVDYSIITIDNAHDVELIKSIEIPDMTIPISSDSTINWYDDKLIIAIVGSDEVRVASPSSDVDRSVCFTDGHIWRVTIKGHWIYCLDLNNYMQLVDLVTGDEVNTYQFNSEWFISSLQVADDYVFVSYFEPSEQGRKHKIEILREDLSEPLVSQSSGSSGLWELAVDNSGNTLVLLGDTEPQLYRFSRESASIELITGLDDISYAGSAVFNLDGSEMVVDGGSFRDDVVSSTAFLYAIGSTPELLWTFTDDEFKPFAFTLDNDMLIVGMGPLDEELAFINISDDLGAIVQEFSRFDPDYVYAPIVDMALSPDGRLLATLHDDFTIRVWGIPCEDNCEG